jgi:hypothetical protein
MKDGNEILLCSKGNKRLNNNHKRSCNAGGWDMSKKSSLKEMSRDAIFYE